MQAPESTNIFFLQKARFFYVAIATVLEACVAERLTPRTLDLEVRGSSLARRVVSLEKELYWPLCLSSPRCINGTGGILLGGNPAMD